MTFAELKTKLATWINRDNLTAVLGDIVNMTVKEIERDWNYNGMKAVSTGTLSTDNIAFPTRYKDLKSLFITTTSGERLLVKKEWEFINSVFPLSTSTGTPEMCASKHSESKIYVRPYPDITYDYTLTAYVYSADLSGDSDTNWLMSNHWDALFYGSLKNAFLYDKNPEEATRWLALYAENIKQIRHAEIKESLTGSYQNTSSNFVV